MIPMIILPQNIYILRDKKNQDMATNREEYSIYFKNILYPYSEEFDIKIKCDYGKNLGFCWRIDTFTDIAERFPLTVMIYKYGELLSKKEVCIHIVERNHNKATVLCIGDSMTQTETYIEQAVKKAQNIKTVGTRCIGQVSHEGRGGWSLEAYLVRYRNEGGFTSPFLFPEGIEPEKYYGNLKFWNAISENENLYHTTGFEYESPKEGMYALVDEDFCIFKDGKFEVVGKAPSFEFNFDSYLKRFEIERPDIITLLFGANDLQVIDYEDCDATIEKMLTRLEKILSSIKNDKTKIVINLPVCGADQYSWGVRRGCEGTVKQYDHNIKKWSKALIDNYDNREQEGIYLCPMLAVCDPVAGFAAATDARNLYSERTVTHLFNWVHPNESGYKQMGDALAGMLTMLKNKE